MGYVFLALAILFELGGTTCMKFSNGFSNIPLAIGTLLCYGICFFVFSKALQSVDLNIAYATWSGVGIIGASIISVLIFSEAITVPAGIGMGLIVIGVVMVNMFGGSQA